MKKLVEWTVSCAVGLPIGYLIGTALKNAIGLENAMIVSAVALVVLIFARWLVS